MTRPAFLHNIRWQYLAAAAALIVAAIGAVRWWMGPQVAVMSVVRRDYVQTVVASGHIETPNRVDVGSQITATISRIPVQEGDSVQAHDVLVELAATELKAAEQQADSAVIQAQSRLRQLQEVQGPMAEQSLRQARTNLDNAQSTLRRNQDLFKQGFIGQAALDDARKTADLADAQMRSAQKQLDATRGAGSDLALAQSAIAEAQAAAAAAHARAQYAIIRAPVAGVLIARNAEVGDVAQPGKSLMTLSPNGRPQLVSTIDEKNLRLIALGQNAVASADAYPQQKFDARLVYINPGVNAQTGAVEVKFDIPTPPSYLRQDMTVSVDIVVAQRAKTLVLPTSAVHDIDSRTPWVLRATQGRAEKLMVTLGLQSTSVVEVLKGVQEGDQIIPVTANLAAGSRLRPIPQQP